MWQDRENPYVPLKMKVLDTYFESEDKSLKTIKLSFTDIKREEFNFSPGQFAQFSILGRGESPFGIASSPDEDYIMFTINKTGYVTKTIHELSKGDYVGLRGPLGNWYPVDNFKGSNIVIISGGFAFTTLRSLIKWLLKEENRKNYKDITLIYGARTPGMLLYKDELKEWQARLDIKTHITVDKEFPDWSGLVGFVPDVVAKVKPDAENSYAVVCGPPIMIKYTIPKLTELGFTKETVYTSLERRMKCGIGKCGRCNIGEKFVCKDGPVFSLKELEGYPEEY